MRRTTGKSSYKSILVGSRYYLICTIYSLYYAILCCSLCILRVMYRIYVTYVQASYCSQWLGRLLASACRTDGDAWWYASECGQRVPGRGCDSSQIRLRCSMQNKETCKYALRHALMKLAYYRRQQHSIGLCLFYIRIVCEHILLYVYACKVCTSMLCLQP